METEIDWVLSCLDKADKLIDGLAVKERLNGNNKVLVHCLFEARLNINRAIEAVNDSGLVNES